MDIKLAILIFIAILLALNNPVLAIIAAAAVYLYGYDKLKLNLENSSI